MDVAVTSSWLATARGLHVDWGHTAHNATQRACAEARWHALRPDGMLCGQTGSNARDWQGAAALQLLRHLRDGLEQVGDKAVVGHLEDGRLRVLVDGHNRLAVLHARQVLDGAGDAHGNVQLRRHNLARLPDLQVVGHKTGVDGRARGAH